MIIAAAVCPHPPLLLRELSGQQDVAAQLRAACHAALRQVIGYEPDVVVAVGGMAPGEREITAALPLSLKVARRLLDEVAVGVPVELLEVPPDATAEQIAFLGQAIARRPERLVLVVMGDGSARRGEKAPGYIDTRAFEFDTDVGRALADGDPHALLQLDADLAVELMVAGLSAWQVLGTAVTAQRAPVDAKLIYEADPFGVMYFVAVWACAPS